MGNINFKVFRFDPENDSKPRYDTFEVPYESGMRVLTALRYIQENLDETLAFRWNCRGGSCGSCAVRVNDKSVLACKEEVLTSEELVIEPLKTFPVVKDLVVDRAAFNKRIEKLKPYFIPEEEVNGFYTIFEDEITTTYELRQCINCDICYDTCHVIRDGVLDYIGPKAVVKTVSFDKHPMDVEDRVFLLEEEGIWSCNVTQCCTDVCPQEIKITEHAIIYAKEKNIDSMKFSEKLEKNVRKKQSGGESK